MNIQRQVCIHLTQNSVQIVFPSKWLKCMKQHLGINIDFSSKEDIVHFKCGLNVIYSELLRNI